MLNVLSRNVGEGLHFPVQKNQIFVDAPNLLKDSLDVSNKEDNDLNILQLDNDGFSMVSGKKSLDHGLGLWILRVIKLPSLCRTGFGGSGLCKGFSVLLLVQKERHYSDSAILGVEDFGELTKSVLLAVPCPAQSFSKHCFLSKPKPKQSKLDDLVSELHALKKLYGLLQNNSARPARPDHSTVDVSYCYFDSHLYPEIFS
ncbi:hypothetical protein IEQ34_023058 [Dendrobium chrysotoxum]|uniref:Uncharacterized protein n=1 Tax=Dendrobium chrysotoxum TaxID=161865 RepID=A0AAV7G0S8_DENCH|nr:hypothetical protein IEQ34_023058 [Dendrobium chrysotoxum]